MTKFGLGMGWLMFLAGLRFGGESGSYTHEPIGPTTHTGLAGQQVAGNELARATLRHTFDKVTAESLASLAQFGALGDAYALLILPILQFVEFAAIAGMTAGHLYPWLGSKAVTTAMVWATVAGIAGNAVLTVKQVSD
jgi:hypothetical protein